MSQSVATSSGFKIWGGGHSPFNVRWGKLYMWIFLVSDAFTFSSLLIAYGYMRHMHGDVWPVPGDVFTHFPFIHGHAPLAYVGLMTFILIMSSVTMVLAVDAGHKSNRKKAMTWLGWTIVGGFMFLGSQAWEWYHFIVGSEEGSYVLADGRFARTDEYHPGTLVIWDGTTQAHTKIEGAEAEKAIATATKNIKGANMVENEYGDTPLFGNFFFFITGFHGFHVFSGVVINIIVFFLVANGFCDRKNDYELVEKVGLYWHFVDLVWVFVFTFFYLV
jgi:cytochrome c oxidase subunit III